MNSTETDTYYRYKRVNDGHLTTGYQITIDKTIIKVQNVNIVDIKRSFSYLHPDVPSNSLHIIEYIKYIYAKVYTTYI